VAHVLSKWSKDEQGRLVMEKTTWLDFVDRSEFFVADAVMFCISNVENTTAFLMNFSLV
jgi:hypothetical protein